MYAAGIALTYCRYCRLCTSTHSTYYLSALTLLSAYPCGSFSKTIDSPLFTTRHDSSLHLLSTLRSLWFVPSYNGIGETINKKKNTHTNATLPVDCPLIIRFLFYSPLSLCALSISPPLCTKILILYCISKHPLLNPGIRVL